MAMFAYFVTMILVSPFGVLIASKVRPRPADFHDQTGRGCRGQVLEKKEERGHNGEDQVSVTTTILCLLSSTADLPASISARRCQPRRLLVVPRRLHPPARPEVWSKPVLQRPQELDSLRTYESVWILRGDLRMGDGVVGVARWRRWNGYALCHVCALVELSEYLGLIEEEVGG